MRSVCLSLLALLCFPSLGDATQISGSSLIGVSTVSEILDQFFKKQEKAGHPTPAWKNEAQAMMSLVESLKDIDRDTQEKVNHYVGQIIETLTNDTAKLQAEAEEHSLELQGLKSIVVEKLGFLDTQLTLVKSFSSSIKTCRDNVTAQTTEFYRQCTDNDRGATCPMECGKPSTADFELTSEAKQTYTCDFEAGETAKECVARLWGKVNLTRANLTNKYNAWAAKKKSCEEHMARCATCNPLWDRRVGLIDVCDAKRDALYHQYCVLQVHQTGFCDSKVNLAHEWSVILEPAQDERVRTYSDLKFISCIFQKYLETENFTSTMVSNDCPRISKEDFYSFATPPGELQLPTVDSTAVPNCQGAVSHSQGSTLYDMTGLINEFETDGHGTTVSVADSIYTPDASPSSAVCTASIR